MAALKRPIFDFLNSIFEPTRYHANATLRGFYFTSGTQEGTPIDQVIGALGAQLRRRGGRRRGLFGHGQELLPHRSDSTRSSSARPAGFRPIWRAVRRALILKVAAYSAIFAFAALGRRGLVGKLQQQSRADRADRKRGSKPTSRLPGRSRARRPFSDRALEKVEPLLRRLRFLPAGYASRGEHAPLAAKFGLSQHERLHSSSENVYRVALERMFRPRLIYRLEELLEANRTVPGFLYEALKVYLMLGGQQPVDRELVLSWMRRDWSRQSLSGRRQCERPQGCWRSISPRCSTSRPARSRCSRLHGPLIEETQKTLARLSVGQRAYELLKSQARSSSLPDWVPARQGGPDFALVFEAVGGQDLETIRVPGFFTYAGFQRGFVDRLGEVAELVKRERWVLGAVGEQTAVTAQYDALGQTLLDLYTREFIAAWRAALGKLAAAPAHGGQAEIHRPWRRRGGDVSDQAASRIHTRRDRADARAAQAAGRDRSCGDAARWRSDVAAATGSGARHRDRGCLQGVPCAGGG